MFGDSYIPGALMLAYLLKNVYYTQYEVSIMVTDDVSEEGIKDLARIFDNVFIVDFIRLKELDPYIDKFIQNKWKKSIANYKWLHYSLTKFNLFKLVQYEKICFLDADMFPLRSPDDIFNYVTPAGLIKDDTYVGDSYDLMYPPETIFNSIKAPNYGIRGGLMVLEPNKKTFDEFIGFCNHKVSYLMNNFYQINAGPDETLITLFYLDRWHRLNSKYMNKKYTIDYDNYFQHNYTEKPWLFIRDYPEFKLFYTKVREMLKEHPRFTKYYSAIKSEL
jgi:alpha-N-acetylglucosamine transferase